jgi:hypothetical protein
VTNGIAGVLIMILKADETALSTWISSSTGLEANRFARLREVFY